MVSHHTQYKTQIPDQGPQASIQDSPAHLFDLITLLLHVLDTSLKKLVCLRIAKFCPHNGYYFLIPYWVLSIFHALYFHFL